MRLSRQYCRHRTGAVASLARTPIVPSTMELLNARDHARDHPVPCDSNASSPNLSQHLRHNDIWTHTIISWILKL